MALIINEPDVPHMRLPYTTSEKCLGDQPGVGIEPTTFGTVVRDANPCATPPLTALVRPSDECYSNGVDTTPSPVFLPLFPSVRLTSLLI